MQINSNIRQGRQILQVRDREEENGLCVCKSVGGGGHKATTGKRKGVGKGKGSSSDSWLATHQAG